MLAQTKPKFFYLIGSLECETAPVLMAHMHMELEKLCHIIRSMFNTIDVRGQTAGQEITLHV